MDDEDIIAAQLAFYRSGRAGCMFAAHAAKAPSTYGWRLSTSEIDCDEIGRLIEEAIAINDVTTQSVVFPTATTEDGLVSLLDVLSRTKLVTLEQREVFGDSVCLGYRVRVGGLSAWMTGFGPFVFLPRTRQAPHTEIVFRAKPRPHYDKVMKEAPVGVIHLADMHMKGMRAGKFTALWGLSFANTKKRLGHDPDLRSAAKTTFAVPRRLRLL